VTNQELPHTRVRVTSTASRSRVDTRLHKKSRFRARRVGSLRHDRKLFHFVPDSKAEEATMALFRLLWRRSSSYSAAAFQRYFYQPGGGSIHLLKHQRQQQCCASTDKERDDEQRKPPLQQTISALMATAAGRQQLLQTAGTGTSQVIFVNSRDNAGAVILLSLALGDPSVAFMAGVGSFASTVTAVTTLSDSTTSKSATANGLFSYNGCLVGCATAGLICPGSNVFAALPLAVAGAATSTYLTALLMKSPMPQWTIAFNIFTYMTLLALSKNNGSSESVTAVADAVVGVASTTTTVSYLDLFVSPLTSLAQIFVVESAWSGLGICMVIARYSPQLAGHAVLGSAVGSLTGSILLGADPHSIAAGLWGYNSALTSIGTAVFLRYNRPHTVWLVSGVGAALTAVTFGAMSAVSPVPCLTIPFCTVMSGVWWLAQGQWVDGVTLAKNPHSPERNLD
jgi:urea transporter